MCIDRVQIIFQHQNNFKFKRGLGLLLGKEEIALHIRNYLFLSVFNLLSSDLANEHKWSWMMWKNPHTKKWKTIWWLSVCFKILLYLLLRVVLQGNTDRLCTDVTIKWVTITLFNLLLQMLSTYIHFKVNGANIHQCFNCW